MAETTQPSALRQFLSDLKEDVGIRRAAPPSFGFFLWCLFSSRGFIAVYCYRLSRLLDSVPLLPALIRRFAVFFTHVSIHESAEIASGLVLPHPSGVVIGRNVKIGRCAHIYQNVVLGPKAHEEGADSAPVIGDFVHLYPGSCVFGNVEIGDLCEIGANAVVLKSVPESSVVMPPPCTVFRGMAFNKRDFDTGQKPKVKLEKLV